MAKWEGSKCFSQFHNLELIRKERNLNGKALVQKYSRADMFTSLNSYVEEHIDEFYVFVDNELAKLYGSDYSFYRVLYGSIKTVKEINEEFPDVIVDKRKKDYIKKQKRKADRIIKSKASNYPFSLYNNKLEEFKKKYDFKHKFKSILNTCGSFPNDHKLGFDYYYGRGKKILFNYYVEDIIAQTFIVFVHQLQNPFRKSRGIPNIGEGWVSETELYYLLKESFISEEIVHHGKPKWLGRQHVDIWFPKRKIGVEFQGLQHDQPIEHFGGEEGFLKGKERDERKKKLFKENNSILIEVRKGYKLDDVINEIKQNF